MKKTSYANWPFDTITKYTIDIILIVDQNRRALFSTPSFTEIFGIAPEELSKRDIFDIIHPDDKENLMKRHRNVMRTQQPSVSEYRVIDKYSQIRHFECRTTPIPDNKDKLTVVAVRDITDRKTIETKLEYRKNRYEELQNSLMNVSQDLSSVLSLSGLEEQLLKEVKAVLPDSDPHILIGGEENPLPPLTVGKLEYVTDKILIKIGDRQNQAYVLALHAASIHENMELIWLETFVCYAIMVFESLQVIENLSKQLETALQSKEKPQWILRLLFHLSEKQRLDLSGDLHDAILQEQINLYRRLEALLQNDMDGGIKGELKGIEQGLLDTIHQIRITCNELRPPLLRELGLERALENLFDYTQVSSTFKITFTTERTVGLSLNEEQTIGIFRIVQELLNNAAKHSKASVLHFRFSKEDHVLKLEYIDDGIGFETEKLSPTFDSMGLSSMKQRAHSLGGSIEFFSQPDKGLKATMVFPITAK